MLATLFSDYNLLALWENIRKRLVWVILAAVIMSGASYFYFSSQNVDMYSSYVTLYASKLGSDENENAMDSKSYQSKEFNSSSSLANGIRVILNEGAVAEKVNSKLEKYSKSPSDIASAVTVETVEESSLIKITAVTTDPNLSFDICNAYVQVSPQILDNILNGGSVTVVTEPTVASTPIHTDYKIYAVYGAAAGAGLALAVIVLMFVLDGTMKSSEEISERFGLKLLAEIPSYGKKSKKNERNKKIEDSREKVINNETPFLAIESFKIARTNIIHAFSDIEGKGATFIATSFEPSAGKSLISANLAITMAKRDQRVLIIDADMRKPMQHKLFAIDNELGLSSILSGKRAPAECIFKLQGNLHIMPSGPIPANPSELIDSSVMTDLLSAVSQVYDYIIIDTPPIGVVTDASALAPKTDGVVLIARQKSTTSSEFQRSIEELKKVDARIIGTIFTDVSGYSKSYGKYRYKNGYRYRYKYRYDSYEYKEDDKSKKEK